MNTEVFKVGVMATNCCLLYDDKSGLALIVDPGAPSDALDKRIDEIGTDNVKYILLTHGHFDHIGNAKAIKDKTGADIVIYNGEESFLKNSALNLGAFMDGINIPPFDADILVKDGDMLPFGELGIKIIHTPGHTSGGCCYIVGDVMFSGDTLMARSMGRTDFPTGDETEIFKSLRRIKNLEGDYSIYCGHGNATTLERERKTNPYMKHEVC